MGRLLVWVYPGGRARARFIPLAASTTPEHEPVRRGRDDPHPLAVDREDVVVAQLPARVGGLRLVRRPGVGAARRAALAQVERTPPARRREAVAGRPGHDLVPRVPPVRGDPGADQRVAVAGCHGLPASDARGPPSVAFMRSTCPDVNITIAASST